MAKNDSILIQKLYPIVEQSLKNNNIIRELNLTIGKFIDRNSEILYDIGPTNRLIFPMDDKNEILKASGLDIKQIKDALKESEYIDNKWFVANDPVNIASVLMLRYFTISKNKKQLQIFLLYFGLYFYAMLHYQYFPYGANKNIMDYTINNLSNKYKIKQLGSVYKTVENTVNVSHNTYEKQLIKGTDNNLIQYISSLRVRINDFLKNIKNEYNKNHDNENYLNYDSDDYSEENYHIADNLSYQIKRITDATVLKLNTYGPNMALANLAAQITQVSQNEIRNVITHLTDKDTEDVRKLCELILILFLSDPKNDLSSIRTQEFLLTSIEIYKKSNTNDKVILDMKDILSKWLTKYSPKYNKTNRQATLSNFRKSIFVYFVLYIQNSNK